MAPTTNENNLAPASQEVPSLSFTAEDCALFTRYPNSVSWNEVSKQDQDLFKSIRERLKKLSESLADSSAAPLPLKAETSHPTPNGRSPREIWCCIFPKSVPNKSYGLQIALIISKRGAELCFCQGSGTSQVGDPAKKQQFEEALTAARKRLGDISNDAINAVETAQNRKWWYRKSWLQTPNEGEFSSLGAWLQYASSPDGGSASVSVFLTPAELQDLGPQISTLFAETLETFSPILTAVYSNAPTSQFWIFQGNPDKFDMDTYLRTRPVIQWQLRQYAERLKAGAQVLIWRSGENSGVIAECVAESDAIQGLEDDAPELYLVQQENTKAMPRCRLKVLKQYVDKPIPRQKIKVALPGLSIITFANNTNYPISSEEYARILSLTESAPQNSLQELLRRYSEEQIIFRSSKEQHRYAIASCDENGVNIERLDANERQRLTFSQADKLINRVKEVGSLEFSSLDDTSAVRNTVLQAEPFALNHNRSHVVFLPDNQARLDNFLQVLASIKRDNRFYKPAMLLCVLDGIESGELSRNRITFDWIAPRFIAKMDSMVKDITEREAAMPFFHLTGDLFWLHAVPNLRDLMQDGGEGPAAARKKIKYAVLKDTYWTLLQDPASLAAVRFQLEALIMPTNEELFTAAKTAIENTGFQHDPKLVGRFLGALATKPFVILTGNSGTGKTKLAQLIAHWLAGDSSEAKHRYSVVPVGADWTDNRNVVGFVNHLRKGYDHNPIYQSTPVLDLLLRATGDSQRPYFLILDEMNLSHVERYFADFLSAMESKKSIPLHNETQYLRTPAGVAVPQAIIFPDNLFVIGTVNVDETTYMFSPKVLDRANVLEFRIGPEQAGKFLSKTTTQVLPTTPAIGAPFAFLALSRQARGLSQPPLSSPGDELLTNCRTSMQDLFDLLHGARLEFAFRTIAEINHYIHVDFQFTKSAWAWESCMDAQVLQKILPKLHGSRRRLEAILISLMIYCEKRDRNASLKVLQRDAELNRYPDQAPSDAFSFPLSRTKLLEMIEAVRRDQFVSYIQ
jgi:hypothetical protein